MALLVLFAGLGMICALLWYCAVYALPVFVGFSVGWWALNHGAGVTCIVAGLVAGVATWLAGRLAVKVRDPLLRLIGIAVFVVPAAFAGFGIMEDFAGSVGPIWKELISFLSALIVSCVTYARIANSGQKFGRLEF